MIPDPLRAEWTKARTTPGAPWLFLATIALTVAVGAAAAAAVHCPHGCAVDAARTSLAGVMAGQATVVIMAVLAVTGEYGTGMIRVTFAAIPRRAGVFAAKAVVVGGLTLAAGVIAVPVSLVAGRFLLANHALSLAEGQVWRAAIGSVLYLVLVGLLGLGVATAVRDAGPAIGIVLALLYLFPVVANFGDQPWFRHVEQIGPMTAGLAIQVTLDVAAQPIAPWTGLGVLSAWAGAALLAGGLLLRLRDA